MELVKALDTINAKCTELKSYLLNEVKICRFSDIFIDKTHEVVIEEVYVGDRNFMVRINEKRNEVIFRDDLSTPVAVEHCWGVDREVIEPLYNKLLSQVVENGGKIEDSGCGGNDDYDWMDLSFKLNEFTVDKLNVCEKLWGNYNKCVDEIVKNSRR